MQALEKISLNNNWITIVILILLVLITVLKTVDSLKFKGYVFAFFNKGFIESEMEEEISLFSWFYSLLFVFSISILALVGTLFISTETSSFTFSLPMFLYCFLFLLSFFSIKWALEIGLIKLFKIKNLVRFYIVSKFSYFYSTSFPLFVIFIIVTYSNLEADFLFYFAALLFLFRFFFQIKNNKNLIFNKLFYFILYLCAFEIVPIIILFKMML